MALLVAISLRGVIRDFRMTAWYGAVQFSQTEKARLMIRLLSNRIATEGLSGAIGGGVAQTAQRSANMDVFADVVRRTPSEVPYWNGQTYLSLVGAAVPRFLWPDKPTKELGQAFGHRYRYLDPSNTSTAINLPITVEFYANFGSAAVFFGIWSSRFFREQAGAITARQHDRPDPSASAFDHRIRFQSRIRRAAAERSRTLGYMGDDQAKRTRQTKTRPRQRACDPSCARRAAPHWT
jgi:hypothetical protein